MRKLITILLSFLFFVFGLATLADYGINWDAVSHLQRGQAYLHFYLTGERDYTDLKSWNLFREKETGISTKAPQESVPRYRVYFQKVDSIFFDPDIPRTEIPRVSMYQNVGKNLNDIMIYYDYGHPHISDVLSSAFNFIFFQKLGLLNDVDSYRVYGVLLASALVGLIFWWTAQAYGKFAGLVAALSLALNPLFWAESHFNTEKDIPETVFFTFTLFSFWKGITSKNWKWILVFGAFFGLALGTKFNILFSIFVILPWLTGYLISRRSGVLSFKILLALIVSPLLGVSLVIGTWPYFWSDPIGKISKIVDFYKTIGTTVTIDQGFIGPFGINTYAFQWILYTTPLVILLLAILGIFVILSAKFKEKNMQSLIFLLMFLIPIARVTWPGMNIYGGVRQIMEYIPPMAIIAGIGGAFFRGWLISLLNRLKISRVASFVFASLLVLALFIPITLKLIEIHPNENVYFNPLIGGIKGARDKNFPGWGVTLGVPYREAIEWVNKNAEPGSRLTLAHEIMSNIPGIFIRPDIDYKRYNSGYLRQGEYVISLVYHGTGRRSYNDMYLNTMIEPVHQIVVDGVPILKIWKNDKDHLKPQWREEVISENVIFNKSDGLVSFDIGKPVKLSRMEIDYDESNCPELSVGYLMTSKDGQVWERAPGVLPEEARINVLGRQPRGGKFIEPFVGQVARYINFYLSPDYTCVTQIESMKLFHFK